jgi:hypothetical protein
MRFFTYTFKGLLSLAFNLQLVSSGAIAHNSLTMAHSSQSSLPTQVLAGITVIDTPLVRAAQAYARTHGDDMTYNHVMRAWLFSVTISKKVEPVVGPVDLEAQALAAILHDLGWDKLGELVSKDKRFEVDGAIAAKKWIEAQIKEGAAPDWDIHRIQLLWDTIALHTTPSIAAYKEPVVALVGAGIAADFQGPKSDPTGTLTRDEFNAVNKEFPRHNIGPAIRKIICDIIETKPATTFGMDLPFFSFHNFLQRLTTRSIDNWQMQYGIRFVKNYNATTKGGLAIDMVDNAV